MNEVYGNTMADLRRVSIVGAILGAFAGIGLGAGYYKDGRFAHDWPAAVIGALVIGSIVPLIVLPTCFFSIRLDGQHITHLFCRRIILKQRPVSQLKSVRVGLGGFAVVFRFADGSRIHFGGHTFESLRLCVAASINCSRISKDSLLADDMHSFHALFINSIPNPNHQWRRQIRGRALTVAQLPHREHFQK